MQVKGRYLVIAWTAVFLAAVAAIVVRDGAAYPARRRLDQLDERISELQGMRADYQARITALETPDSLARKAQGLGLRMASDSEIVMLAVPPEP